MAMCWYCFGDGEWPADENTLFGNEAIFPLNGAGMPCPECGGSGEVEGIFENAGSWW